MARSSSGKVLPIEANAVHFCKSLSYLFWYSELHNARKCPCSGNDQL